MACYEMLVTVFKTVVVEAEDADEAISIVEDEVRAPFGWERDDISVESVLKTEVDVQTAIDSGADDLRN